MRYVATVRFDDGRECIVFPRSKKTNTYPTIEAAERRLDSWAKAAFGPGCNHKAGAQGRVKLNDEIVWTVAL